MNSTSILAIALTIFLCLMLGCHAPGPVEIQQDDVGVTQVQPVSGGSDFENEQDTVGLVAGDKSSYAGQLVVAEARFDTDTDSSIVAVARALFLDKGDSVVVNGHMIGYKSVDVGTVFIDGLPLYRLSRRIRFMAGSGMGDTLAGFGYQLVTTNGVGGRGFSYSPAHLYEWNNFHPGGFTFDLRNLSAREVRVTSPTAKDEITRSTGLAIEWSGGEDTINLIVSVPQPGRELRPLYRMRLQSARRRVVIPSKVLQLLPTNRLMFSFVSQRNEKTQLSGFQGTVLVHSASIHNLLLTVKQ